MAKDQYTTQSTRQNQDTLNTEHQALVAALTSAILSSRSDRKAPSQEATDAAAQYAEIRRSLKTFFEGREINRVAKG